MAMHHTAPCRGPVAIADLFNNALEKLTPDHRPASGDGFLFSGNRHESVPRRLFLDSRLTPLERNAWQVFRLMLNDDGVTAFPTYEQLRPWLASMPCTARASHETVARALTLLRLTRWLSLVRRRRDPNTGRILGNLYVLHDEPLTPFEAMQLDADYLELVSQSIGHSAKAVQIVGLNTLQEIAEDPLLSGRTLPSRLQVIAERLAREDIGTHESYPQDDATHDSEEGVSSLLRNREHPSTDSEAGPKPAPDNALRNPKEDSTVRNINKVRTTARATQDVRLPDRFIGLKEEQQSGAMVALQQVDASLRQAVLDEWEERCRGSNIRNPAGYLFGIIQRAIRGEFNAWARGKVAHESDGAAVKHSAPPERQTRKMAPGLAKQYLDQMRDLLKEG